MCQFLKDIDKLPFNNNITLMIRIVCQNWLKFKLTEVENVANVSTLLINLEKLQLQLKLNQYDRKHSHHLIYP